ncbi:unnamed protein product [Paramecium pentaurelia]|uniref:WD40-repeat-containing domain n=1 Tax=Paramecium pentaurelia TaxID=43138 RepID=A0A8S1XSS0_9CILI|nr:unnamed protein product [Paramecium pentaurelia]
MMKILKGQNMQKAYIFSKLEFNLKSTLETKQNKELKQQDNNQQQEISISALILEQKTDIEVLMYQDLKNKSCIDTILKQFVKLRDRIIANFASQQNSLVISALILQTQLYNSFFKLNLSSYQDIEQCKKEILELYQQYDQNQILNNIQFKNTQDQIQAENIEQNEYLILISENINELNNQIMNINRIIDNMQQLSKYVHQNCMGFEFFTEDHFQKYFLDNVKSIIKELIIQLQLDQLLNQFIQNNLDKQQNSGTQIKNIINFTLKDFATIFCYNQITSEKAVQIDKDYQELLDNLEQEMIVERKIYDLSKDYIVRQCFLFHLIKIQSQVPEKELLLLCQEYIKRIWMIEKDESVRAFLKNKEVIEIQKLLFSHDLKTFSSSMKEEMNQKLKELDDIEQAIRFEGNQSKRDELSKQLTNQYEEFEEFLDNISEMSQQLDITLIFLKELQKNIKQIKKKIDDLQESINEIGNDVRKLRGKKYDELLLIRKEKVLSQAYLLEVDSVYIPLKTQESIQLQGKSKTLFQVKNFLSCLLKRLDKTKQKGVNQFIYDEQQKCVMLIKGQAGSARKIEAYLWKQKLDEKDWIPIYKSLPQLKNPKFNLLDQTLESENYGFDKLQLKDFKEAISSNKIKLVLILDSYDEMKQDCIQSNLILTNRLIQDRNQVDQIKKVKFIITTRKEILTSLGYQTWFYGESLQTLKEVEIMNFDKQQSENYLKHYVKLSIKIRIKSSYDFVKQIKQQNLDVKEFLEIWNNILDQVDDEDGINENSTMLLTDEQIENILEIIQKQPAFQYVQEDQLIILKKELKDLWSAGLFNKTIQNLKIQHFLQTPFMLEIVVQTLPNLSQKYKGSQEIKEMFQKNFLILKSKENLSKMKLSKFIYLEQKKVQIIIEENTYKQSEIQQDYENQQDLKSLQIILEKLESQHFFEKYSITDISLIKNQIINISEDDLKIVIAALKMKIFTIYEFYQNFIECYHEQQLQKLRQLGKVENVDSFTIDLLQFSESLAIELNNISRLKLKNDYFDQNNEDDWKIQYFDDLEDDYRKLVRSSALINVKGKSYTFNHKSLQEFYVAKHINNLIDKLQFIDNQLTQKSVSYLEKSVFNKKEFNISLENYFGSLRILKENLKLKNENNLKLISIAKLSAKKTFKVASSNSFCLLSYLQVYLGEQDFSGIHIEKTTFKGLSFYKSKLKKSIFNEVIIDSCLFDQANLEEAKWTNMICSEKPLLQGHKGSVVVIQYSNNGKLIASADSQKVKKFWDDATFQQEGEISDISGLPKFLVFSDDDQLLFVGSDTNRIESWLISDLKKIIKSNCVINKQEKIIKMQLSQNEKELLAVDERGLIQFWDINLIKTNFNEKDGFILKSSDSKIKFISFFKNGQMLASVSDDKKVTLWDVIEQKVEAIIEISFPITYLAINQTSEFPVCVSNESKSENLSVWNIENINQPYLLRTSSKYHIDNIYFTTDNQKSIENLEDVILIQNSSNISEQEEYYQIINCTCIDFSPDENLIATSSEEQISLWSLQTNTPITSLENDSLVNVLRFIEQGKKLLSGNYDKGVKLWSVEKFQLINFFQISYTQNITISSNYDRMAIQTNREYKEVVIIKLDQLQFNSFDDNGMKVSISQNDQLFVINYNYTGTTYYVIKLDNDQQVEFESSKNNFEQCVFSHQSSLFASFNKDQQLQIWTYEGVKFSLKHEERFGYKISCMIFSFDDKYLAMTSQTDQLIIIWDFFKNSIYTLKESINEVGNYNYQLSPDICFSCDSLQVAFYNSDEIKIWNFLSNQTNSIFKDDNSKVRTIASSPKQIYLLHLTKQLLHSLFTGELTKCLCFIYDGKYLISARSILKLWDISNFPQIKLCAATDSFQGYNVEKICCLHKTQGILHCCSYRRILESSDQSKIEYQFSSDSRFLVGGIDKKVIIWDNDKNYQIEFSYPFPDIIQSVTYCQDQERLIVTIPSGIYILNIKSTNILEVIPNLKSAFYAKIFQNDQYLYTKEDKSVKIWRNDGDNQFTLIDYYNFQTTEKIVFSKDGKYLAKLKDDYFNKSIIIYPIDLIGKRRFILNKDQSTIRISNHSKYQLYGNDKLSKLSYFESDVTIDEFTELGYFEFSPDNENIVFQNDKNYTLYNINSKQNISQFSKYKDYQSIYSYSNSYSVQFSNDGKILVLAYEQIILVNITDINKPQFIGIIQDKITSLNPKTSSKYLASTLGENSIQINDMITRKFIKSIKINITRYYNLKDLVILLNDSKVAYLDYNKFKVQNLIDDKTEYNYSYTEDCDTIAISKDRKNLIFSSGNQVYFYQNINQQEFNKLEENIKFLNFSFSQDSKYLAGCGTNNIIYFWDFKARKVMAKFEGHSEKVYVVQISQDNSTLASCSDDKLIRLWNLNVNFNRITQDGHENKISKIMFSADSLLLYSSGAIDYTLKLWDMEHKVLIISKTFDYLINSFSITQNQDYLIITQGETVELWNIQYIQAIQKSLFEIIPGGCPSYNFKIKGNIQKIQLLSNDKQFVRQPCLHIKTEIWEKNDKIDESAILYEYEKIEIRLYQISQDFKYICSVDSQNELSLGELSLDSKLNLIKLKQYNNDKIINLLFSNDSKILSSVDSQNIVFRILDSDQLLCSLNLSIEPDDFFQYFTDDDKFYYTNFKNKIYLWNVNHLVQDQNFQISQLELNLENVDIQYFTISNNLKHLVIGLNDSQNNNILRVVELNQIIILKNIHQNSKIKLLLFSDDDMLLALANELNEILVYEINQFTITNSFQCHQAPKIKMQFFFYKVPLEIENNDEPQQMDNLDEQIIQIQNNEQENVEGQPQQIENIQEDKKDIIQRSILSLISFDQDYSIVINYLDNLNTHNQVQQLPNKSVNEIKQVVLLKIHRHLLQLQMITIIVNSVLFIIGIKISIAYLKTSKIVDFCFDQNYLVYSDLYLYDYQNDFGFFQREEIKINYNNYYPNEPFTFLKISSPNSILFLGDNQYMYCWKFCKEENQVQLILLKMTQYNNFDYTTMFLRQDSQIFCLMNNKILKLDFLDAIEKLKSCLNYYSQKDQRYEYQIKKLEAPNIQFKHCRFSSDLSLCVSIGQGRLFVFQSERNYGGSQYQYKEYFKYLILWNIKTQKYDTLIEPYTTKIGYNRYPILFTDVAVFIPNQNIMVSNKDRTIEFRNCQDFDSITTIATLDNERRIKNLIVSQDGKLLISICEIGIFKLWNISEINQITLQRVIYYEKELVHYRFTNDICCYSLYQRKEEKKYYLESLNLTKYPVIYAFQSFKYFNTFLIMQQETIIALGGGQLVLWNYKSNQNKSIIENNDECFTQIIFGNNSNNLVAARGCVIYLINEITEALNFTSISELKGHQGKIVCLSILYDNQMIVSGSQDKTIRFWSIPQLATVYILLGFIEIISKITLSPNCKDMAVAMEDGSIRLFELQFPENIHDLKLDEINNQSDYTHCYKEDKKDIIQRSILSLISFDQDYSIVINYLDNLNTHNQVQQLPNKSVNEIKHLLQQCVIYNWDQNKYSLFKNIKDC